MSLPRRGHHDERREDVLREIDVLLDLDHPNIVGLREYFVHNDKVYLIMELLRGELLSRSGSSTHASATPLPCTVWSWQQC
jgi:calcium/calmodulin-dependent protein kinase I